MTLSVAGKSVRRNDLREKLTGQARYSADLKLPDMLHAAVLRSPHPHADILSVDTADTARLPGVFAILTPFDAPQGRVAPDVPVLDSRVRFVGDEVAASDPEATLRAGAVSIHPAGNLATGQPLSLERGDVSQGLAEADLILEEEYSIPTHSATPLEPRAGPPWPPGRGIP